MAVLGLVQGTLAREGLARVSQALDTLTKRHIY